MPSADFPIGDRLAGHGGRTALAALALLIACRFEVGGAEIASSSPPPIDLAGDTLRADCRQPLPALFLPEPVDLGVEGGRLLAAADGLLVVGRQGGLHRHSKGRTERLLDGGRDYALFGETLARLEADRIEVFDYHPPDAPRQRAILTAQSHDTSIALLERAAFVHSGFNRRALVLRRSLRDGAVEAALLSVERDLLRTLLLGPERLHEDEGLLTAGGTWLLHVPWVGDPVQAVNIGKGRRWVLELAQGRRGRVRLDRKMRRQAQSCPGCPRRVELSGRVAVVPLYAAAAIEDGVFWILRLDPAGASRAVLLRVTLDAPEVRAWRLAFPTTPGALAVWRDSLAIAAGPDLWRLPLPRPGSGARCRTE